jgi:hypothetical protein
MLKTITKINDDHNIELNIAFGRGIFDVVTNRKTTWSKFVLAMTKSAKADIDADTYRVLDKKKKLSFKSANGYLVGGSFSDGKRNAEHLQGRCMITLDLEGMTDTDLIDDLYRGCIPGLDYEGLIYSTLSHRHDDPRFRIMIPLTGVVDVATFDAVSRLLADEIDPGLEQTDPVSFVAPQAMFMPAHCRDVRPHFAHVRGAFLDADEFLSDHPDWREPGYLPMTPRERDRMATTGIRPNAPMSEAGFGHLMDPRKKRGITGAFNRVFSISSAINEFLNYQFDYVRTAPGQNDRYTFVGSSTEGGVVVYNDLHTYSHHATDPYNHLALDAFSLVRLHTFGALDAGTDPDTPYNQYPSVIAMTNMAKEIPAVTKEMTKPALSADAFSQDALGANCPVNDTPNTVATMMTTNHSPADNDNTGINHNDIVAQIDALLPALDDDLTSDEVAETSEVPKQTLLDRINQLMPLKESQTLVIDVDAEGDFNGDWSDLMIRDAKGKIAADPYNALMITQHHPVCKNVFGTNMMTGEHAIKKTLSFGVHGLPDFHISPNGFEHVGKNILDAFRLFLSAPLDRGGIGINVKAADVESAIGTTSELQKFHPIIDIIDREEWDGVPRVDTMLIDYLQAEDNSYTRLVSRNMVVASVARVKEPAHQYDSVPVIEGNEGIGKSTFLTILYYEHHTELTKKEANDINRLIEKTRSSWVIEIAEMSAFVGMADVEVKNLMSPRSDGARLAYKKGYENIKREGTFVATTNDDTYLAGLRGNRRFLPVPCHRKTKFDIEALRRNRQQIWAEANAIYKEMRREMPIEKHIWLPLFMNTPETAEMALRMQEKRRKETDLEASVNNIAYSITRALTFVERGQKPAKNHAIITVDGVTIQVPKNVCTMSVWHDLWEYEADVKCDRRESAAIIDAFGPIRWISKSARKETFVDQKWNKTVAPRQVTYVIDTDHSDFLDEIRAAIAEVTTELN